MGIFRKKPKRATFIHLDPNFRYFDTDLLHLTDEPRPTDIIQITLSRSEAESIVRMLHEFADIKYLSGHHLTRRLARNFAATIDRETRVQ